MKARWPAGMAAAALAFATAATARAQAHPIGAQGVVAPTTAATTSESAPPGLRSRFGSDVATALLFSADAEDRFRGIQRLASMHTPEALALLVRAVQPGAPGAGDSHAQVEGVARKDPRALLAAVRGLARWADLAAGREALRTVLDTSPQLLATRVASASASDETAEDIEGAGRILLARQEAAMALAASDSPLALEALIDVGRSAGAGQAAAVDALAMHPPSQPLLGGVVLTTPATIALAVAAGDLRSLDAMVGALSASDPALRAMAIAALGLAGDSRVLESARAALADPDPRVRLAAGDALVRLGTPDAARAVEALVADDATALGALRLAELVQGDGVTKSAAARAVASADPDLRAAAVSALGRQRGPLAVGALTALVADPALRGDAACALARSPDAGATAAIEAMARTAPRLAARAYFVRRAVRGERSDRLDALLASLVASKDPRDRAAAIEAAVATARVPLADALGDPDARVRRAAAAGSLGVWSKDARNTLLARLTTESDEGTRQVLSVGLYDGDPDAVVPTLTLLERARGPGADAPLAAFALARRDGAAVDAAVDALLASHDPVLRAHVARGLGARTGGSAIGKLAHAYAIEGDARVRRAIIDALSSHAHTLATPAGRETLELAARLDPDRWTRSAAADALAGREPSTPPAPREIAWLRAVTAEGAAGPAALTGAFLRNDGVALPFAFDDDGYALVLGVAGGSARVRLAPRVPAYDAGAP
ncbi:MAG TPA: HEAT repeat domain-containing protein [Polyangiaceae bacterium]|jgi:HEAT repeat protein